MQALLAERYPTEVEAILAKHPQEQKRSAVLPLLHLAQRAYGRVTPEAIDEVARLLDIDPTQVGSLVGFYSLFYDRPQGEYRLQICTDLPCALRGAEAFARELCQRLGIEPGGTTADGLITVETVMCLAACDKAPMLQVQSADGIHYHENQTVESALALVDMLRRGLADG